MAMRRGGEGSDLVGGQLADFRRGQAHDAAS